MQLARASQFSLAELTRFWNLGYEGYFVPITFTEAALANWIRCGDFDLDKSVVQMDGSDVVGFSFLGVRGVRGWIGGFGVAPNYRGKGHASALFAAHVAEFPSFGMRSVQLEVLVQNWAQKVYARAGFQTRRRVSVLVGTVAAAPGSQGTDRATVVSVTEALAHSDRLHAEAPAVWQREPAYLSKSLPDTASALVIGPKEQPNAFAIYQMDGENVRLSDVAAVDETSARAVADSLRTRFAGRKMGIVNEPTEGAAGRALQAIGLAETSAQYEMVWECPTA